MYQTLTLKLSHAKGIFPPSAITPRPTPVKKMFEESRMLDRMISGSIISYHMGCLFFHRCCGEYPESATVALSSG